MSTDRPTATISRSTAIGEQNTVLEAESANCSAVVFVDAAADPVEVKQLVADLRNELEYTALGSEVDGGD